VEQFRKPGAAPVGAALDRAHGDAAHFGGLLVGKALRAHEAQRLALFGRKLCEGGEEVRKLQLAVVLRLFGKRRGEGAVHVLHLALGLAAARIEGVAQDGEKPGPQVRPGLELVEIRPGLDHGVLHEIVGRR
jgi:hypothetical protein